jgi:C4-dicarboxylate-specific signal transduction histidine kinase
VDLVAGRRLGNDHRDAADTVLDDAQPGRLVAREIAEAICFSLLLSSSRSVAFVSTRRRVALAVDVPDRAVHRVGGIRFSQREVTTATAVACSFAIWNVFERTYGGAAINEPLLMLLAFNSTAVTTGLVLCAVLRERDRVIQAIRRHSDELELRVQERTRALEAANQTLQNDMEERRRMEALVAESERRFAP